VRLRLWVTLLLWVGTSAQAAELTHFVSERRIGARIRVLDYPESLRKDLLSGLTTRLLVHMSLLQGDQSRDTAGVEIALKYDLWDELFRVELSIDGAAASAPQLRTAEEALAWLNDLRLPALFEVPAGKGTFILKAEALMNPVERERLERIRKWIKENSSYVPVDGTRGSTSESGSNAILNRIFERYTSGDDVAAQWQREVVSAPFEVDPR
jgi:hypothetical protein